MKLVSVKLAFLFAVVCSAFSFSQTIDQKAAPKIGKNERFAIEFVRIPAGEFLMGSTEKEWQTAYTALKDAAGSAKEEWFSNQSPQRKVKITPAFEIGKFEITQKQWQAVMKTTLREQRDNVNPERKLFGEADDNPIYYVSWEEAMEFCRRLNASDDGYEYRLPTEAEWEYAARAGTTGDYAGDLDQMAWFGDNSGSKTVDALELWRRDSKNFFKTLAENGGQTHAVGGKKPNAWGLYDMHGNVWEWTADVFGSGSEIKSTNQNTPPNAERRVLRGASWDDTRVFARVSQRLPAPRTARYPAAGFRVVRVPKATKKTI